MKLGQLLSGVASGYVTRFVQLIAVVVLVPFLLRPEILGLSGYGNVFAILAVNGLLRFMIDGLRQSFSRDVSQAMDPGDSRNPTAVLGNRVRFMAGACALIVLMVVIATPWILNTISIPPDSDAVAAMRLAIGLFWIENTFYLFRVPLVVSGELTYLNWILSGEVIFRTATYFLLFSWVEATPAFYLLIQVAFAAARNLAISARVAAMHRDFVEQILATSWRAPRRSLHHSLPISGVSFANELVQRIPVLVASRYLGAEAAGLVALTFNTITRYVMQVLFSILTPVAVPIASRLDPRHLSPSRRELLWNVESLYAMSTGILLCGTITCMPQLVRLWLGPAYDAIVPTAQLVLAACSIEISFRFRHAMLVGQGLLGASLPVFATCGGLALVGFYLAAGIWRDWNAIVAVACAYVVIVNSMGIGRALWRQLPTTTLRPSRYGALAFLAPCALTSIALSHWHPIGGVLRSLPALIASTAAAFLLAHWLLMPLGSAIATVKRLRGSLARDVFSGDRPVMPNPTR